MNPVEDLEFFFFLILAFTLGGVALNKPGCAHRGVWQVYFSSWKIFMIFCVRNIDSYVAVSSIFRIFVAPNHGNMIQFEYLFFFRMVCVCLNH